MISLVPVGAPVRVGAPGPWEPVGVQQNGRLYQVAAGAEPAVVDA